MELQLRARGCMIDGRDDQALLMEKLSFCERLHDLWKTQDLFWVALQLRGAACTQHQSGNDLSTGDFVSIARLDCSASRPGKCPLLTSEQGETI